MEVGTDVFMYAYDRYHSSSNQILRVKSFIEGANYMNEKMIHKATVIGEGTVIKDNVEIRQGVVIGKNCYIDSGVIITGDTTIGDNTIIRNRVTIARGSEIGKNCFIAPHCMFNNLDLGDGRKSIGGAKLGNNVTIGTACVLHHGIEIVDNVTVGAMSFIRHDITEAGTYYTKTELTKV